MAPNKKKRPRPPGGKARRTANLRTERETAMSGLGEIKKREKLRGLAGKIRLNVDVSRSRERRRT